MPGGIPGAPPLYLANEGETERQAMELAIGKVSQTHSNLGKVTLKIIQAIGVKPTGGAHSEIIGKHKRFKASIDDLNMKYELILQTKRIPDQAEATTSTSLKQLVCND